MKKYMLLAALLFLSSCGEDSSTATVGGGTDIGNNEAEIVKETTASIDAELIGNWIEAQYNDYREPWVLEITENSYSGPLLTGDAAFDPFVTNGEMGYNAINERAIQAHYLLEGDTLFIDLVNYAEEGDEDGFSEVNAIPFVLSTKWTEPVDPDAVVE